MSPCVLAMPERSLHGITARGGNGDSNVSASSSLTEKIQRLGFALVLLGRRNAGKGEKVLGTCRDQLTK